MKKRQRIPFENVTFQSSIPPKGTVSGGTRAASRANVSTSPCSTIQSGVTEARKKAAPQPERPFFFP